MISSAVQSAAPIRGDELNQLLVRLRSHAGIKIETPRQLIEEHVRTRMAVLGIDAIGQYLALFDRSITARAEWLALVDLLTVKETRFFRQREAFEGVAHYLRKLLAEGPAPRELSFWSAGCATGQELYSIAMVVEQILGRSHPWLHWHGIGTDISFEAIHSAQLARYEQGAIESIPANFRSEHLEQAGANAWRPSADIRARTHFFHSNLLHVNNAPFADFNIIFCQNVLIYFERDRQRWIIDQLVNRLKTGGLLILGAGEDVRWSNSTMRRLSWPGVCAYSKIGG
jgi:chemotaxis methyl-accepting protein methylase